MSRAELCSLSASLNDERHTGGQTKPARLIGWHHSVVWRKLNGNSPITPSDDLAIQAAVGQRIGQEAA